jgi:DNA gyrase subunit A
VIELKGGFNPDAVLEQLYRLTPMEDSFGVNSVALVDGQPRTLGLRELLQVYVDHRLTSSAAARSSAAASGRSACTWSTAC